MPQPVELMASSWPHVVRYGSHGAIRHRIGKPPANSKLAFRAPQQQQTAVPRLVAAAGLARPRPVSVALRAITNCEAIGARLELLEL